MADKAAIRVEGADQKGKGKAQKRSQRPNNFKKKFRSLFEESLRAVADYVEREFKYGGDVSQSLRKMVLAVLAERPNPDPNWKTNMPWEYDKWMTKYRKYTDRVELIKENTKKAYELIYSSQCSRRSRRDCRAPMDGKQ